ncbi:MAG: hypothetical protein KUL88_23850, partial [Rhizobium sp.]|nr:hypothetical protein [Rhizobium sp.]
MQLRPTMRKMFSIRRRTTFSSKNPRVLALAQRTGVAVRSLANHARSTKIPADTLAASIGFCACPVVG